MINILNKSDCCGCNACKDTCPKSAISLICDEEGFLYPQVNNDLCVNCGCCLNVCPIIFRDKRVCNRSPIKVYAAHAKDESLWFTSSSGGVFQVLGNYIIDMAGIVYGAIYNIQDNFRVSHARISDKNQLERIKGSKYVQSDTEGIYSLVKNDLLKGHNVLFSGTPCQVEGLLLYLRKPYKNLITCDIICHCVPSPKIFDDYITFLQKKYRSKIISINMKDKTLGWGHQTLRINFENGRVLFNKRDSNLWNSIFYSRLASRPSCYSCRYSNTNRPGDVTIGDFWGIEKSHPDIRDSRGISLVYANSKKGEFLLECLKDRLILTECQLEETLQDNLKHPISFPPLRDKFWEDYNEKSFINIVTKYFQVKKSDKLLSFIKRFCKRLIGS